MHFIEIIKASFATLTNNRRRTLLTMFGIIIGIAAVITIMSLGNGFKVYTVDNLSADEDGNTSQEFYFTPNNFDETLTEEQIFSQANLQNIQKMSGVADVSIKDSSENLGTYVDIKIKNKTNSFLAEFVQDTKNKEIIEGRPLNSADAVGNKPYVVINENFLEDLFESPEQALHQSVKINNQLFTIIGIFREELGLFTGGAQVYFPEGAENRVKQEQNMDSNLSLQVYFDPETDIKIVSENIIQYLEEEGVGRNLGQYIYVDTAEIMLGIGTVLSTITYFISAVAGISLFIAGIGVMNMMYISVSERTKEIGIRRALGATKGSIQIQFLLEGIFITTFGGIVGYILGIIIAKMISLFLPFQSIIDLQTALLAVIISIIIGTVFSVFPAKSASNKNLIEILR